MRSLWIIGLLAIFSLNRGWAGEALEKHPGYMDFSGLSQIKEGSSEIEVMIKEPLLRMVVEATRKDDAELADLLTKLKLIRVQVFAPNEHNRVEIRQQIKALREKLKEAKWETVVRVREEGENVHVNIKMVNDGIVGLCVFVESEEEAVFINIVGEIDPGALGRIGRKFNIVPLEDLGLDNFKAQ